MRGTDCFCRSCYEYIIVYHRDNIDAHCRKDFMIGYKRYIFGKLRILDLIFVEIFYHKYWFSSI